MASPANSVLQNLLPVQAYFAVDGSFQTFIGQGQPFTATISPYQSGLVITNSTIDSTTIGATTPSTGVFTNILSTTGQVTTSPSGNTDIANKFYVDTVAQGLGPKAACAVGTTANITLSGLQTIDGYTTLSGDRVLVKNQTSSAQNGIYIASASAWTRSTDMDVWSEVSGAYTVLLNGGQSNTGWVCTATTSGTIGVTAMPWVQFSGLSTYFAGTGLTLASNTFSITNTGVVSGSYGSASQSLTATVNAQGQLTSLTAQNIAISASQTTSGTFSSSLLSGSYTGITGVGTLTVGTWNATTIGVAYGGTGATTLTGYVKGSGTSAFTASSTVPTTDLSGTITNAQLQNSTISGVSLGSNLFSLTIGSGLTGTSYNGSSAVTITNSSPMVYPASGIPNSTGTAWGTSYSTTGSGTVVALATGATLNNPTVSNYEAFTPTTAPTYAEGLVWYDSASYALAYYNNTTNNVVHIGQELQQQVRNSTGSTITKGQVVYISGATGQIGNVILAQANAYNSSQVIGVANQDIPNNTNGWIVTQGTVTNINTASFTAGNAIYLSATTAGALTQTEPSAPNYAVHMGVCLYSNTNNGKIYINPINKSIDTGYIIGQVAIAQGGTNGTATPTAGGIAYGSGTAYAFTSAGTSGQVLTSSGSGTPTWSTPTAYATVTDDTTTNATRYPLYASATSGNLTTEYVSSTKYQFNPSTGALTATSFNGAGTGLTGTASSLSIGGNAATATSATTATNLAGGANGSLPYQTGSGATTFLAAGTNGYILTLSGGVPTWASAPVTGITITDDTTTNATRYLTFTSATTGSISGENVSSSKLQYNPFSGVLTSTSFTGAGTGLTGTASSLSIGGNAATVTNGVYTTGSYADPTWITSLGGSKISGNISGNSANVTGTVAIANGGTGQTTQQSAINALSGATTSGYYLRGNGTNVVMSAIQVADVPTLNQNTTGSAAKWTTARTESLTGDITGSTTVDGSANWSIATTLATVNSNVGTYTKITVNAKGLATAATQASLSDLSSPTSSFSIGNQLLTNALDPVSAQDVATKNYVDTVAQGLDAKGSCVCATTANITLSTLQTIDGVTVTAGQRVLVKNQTAQAENGIYVASSSTWTRATDMDAWSEVPNAFTFVEQGTTQADTGWVCTSNAGGTIGTTAITWTQFSGAGTYTAGTGLTLSGTQFSITNTGTAGTYGSATQTPVITTNAQGQVTSVTNTTITPAIGSVTGLGTGIATFLGTPTSANLASAITDETGSGALVFATSPTLVTPILGTPQSGNFSTGVFTWPTFNQNTTGSAATLTTGRTISISGDLTYTSPTFDGSSNVTAIGTLATVNANVGSFTNATVTVNGKGLVTAVSSGTAPVTSVSATSPVASSGGTTPTISLSSGYGDTQNPYASKTANYVLAAPNGLAGAPTFRAIVSADIPTLNQNTTGTAANITATSNSTLTTLSALSLPGSQVSGNISGNSANVTGVVAIANGGTGQTTQASALTALTGTQTSGYYVRSNGTNAVLSAIQASDVPTLNQNTTGTASNVTGTVAIANGGTGQTTASAAFNALSPITTTGDLIVGNGVNSATRLAIGTNGYVLTSNGTTATWAASAGGSPTISNDTTTSSNLYPIFANATSGALSNAYTSNSKLLYKPSTGELSAFELVASNGILVNSATISTSYTIASGNNALSIGPTISMASGATVTVGSTSTWRIQ